MPSVSIQLPDQVLNRAKALAESIGLSFDDLVRECLESRLHEPKRAVDWKNDPFLSDRDVYKGPTPPDLVERLDDYLYGDED
jgi:hypothetical protein